MKNLVSTSADILVASVFATIFVYCAAALFAPSLLLSLRSASPFAFPLSIAVFYVLFKMVYFQMTRNTTRTLFTEETRQQWLKEKQKNLFVQSFVVAVRLAFIITVGFVVMGMLHGGKLFQLHMKNLGKVFLYLLFLMLLALLAVWLDNESNEREWQRKHSNI